MEAVAASVGSARCGLESVLYYYRYALYYSRYAIFVPPTTCE